MAFNILISDPLSEDGIYPIKTSRRIEYRHRYNIYTR